MANGDVRHATGDRYWVRPSADCRSMTELPVGRSGFEGFMIDTPSQRICTTEIELTNPLCHTVAMNKISIRELQGDTERWVRLVINDELIIITDGEQPIAMLVPFYPAKVGKPLPNREAEIRRMSRIMER